VVRKHSLIHKNAFTLIELVFAIVVIAISVVSLPMLVQTTSKGIENNIVQEAIFATGAILNESTTYYWDKHSIDDNNASGGYARVINTGDCSATVPSKRVGHINRQCLDDNTTTPFAGVDNNALEWVGNVYNNLVILEGVGKGQATYKNSYSATATVTYCKTGPCVQFGLEANNPNLKQIEIKVTKTASADTLVVLRAYSANIGEVKPKSKVL